MLSLMDNFSEMALTTCTKFLLSKFILIGLSQPNKQKNAVLDYPGTQVQVLIILFVKFAVNTKATETEAKSPTASATQSTVSMNRYCCTISTRLMFATLVTIVTLACSQIFLAFLNLCFYHFVGTTQVWQDRS